MPRRAKKRAVPSRAQSRGNVPIQPIGRSSRCMFSTNQASTFDSSPYETIITQLGTVPPVVTAARPGTADKLRAWLSGGAMLFGPLYVDPPGLSFVGQASVYRALSDTCADLRRTGQQAANAVRQTAEEYPDPPVSFPAYGGRNG